MPRKVRSHPPIPAPFRGDELWLLIGPEVPGSTSALVTLTGTVGTAAEWAGAGFPLRFDKRGEVEPRKLQSSYVFRWTPITEEEAAAQGYGRCLYVARTR